jgi:gamma-glutamyl hercynylcysteine S-oxide synthase
MVTGTPEGESMLATQSKATDQQALMQRLAAARRNTDELFQIVRTDSLYERPIPERHRIVFYVGHLEAFEWNLLRGQQPSLKSFQLEFDKLFAFGIDPVGGGLPTDRPEEWPKLGDVKDYNERVRSRIDAAIEGGKFGESRNPGRISLDTLLNVAIEHRLMHAETLAYMFHQLPYDRKHRQTQVRSIERTVSAGMVEIPAGKTTLGLSRGGARQFGWDNEYEAYEVEVPAFQIDKYMVTNGEFLLFLGEGGYENRRWWKQEDWRWKEEQNVRQPAFWRCKDGQWFYRGMFEEIALPLEWPVYVSQAEANAYARRTGKSLPTEEQWHRAAYGTPDGTERAYPWGSEAPSGDLGNFDFSRWDPTAVSAVPQKKSAFGVVGQLGNGWEWTSSQFAPFQGFEPFSFYKGYSANFFDGKHYVLKGGSARTAAAMLRRSFRNWFQAHYQYVYAGFRCVAN